MSRSSTSETSEPCVILRCIFSSASFSWTLISLLARDSRIVFLCFADAALRREMRDELSRSCLAVLLSPVEGPASMPTTASVPVLPNFPGPLRTQLSLKLSSVSLQKKI